MISAKEGVVLYIEVFQCYGVIKVSRVDLAMAWVSDFLVLVRKDVNTSTDLFKGLLKEC